MNPVADLAGLGSGFSAPAFGSQCVFRSALDALSHPGRVVRIESDARTPVGLHPAAAAMGLALLDQDTRLWLSKALPEAAGAYLRFHTGCVIAADPMQADFALVHAREMPALDAFSKGSEEYPDRSATVIVQVEALSADSGWTLSGPGIEEAARVSVRGLGAAFLSQWQEQQRHFPRGIDVFLTCGDAVCGLPRTVQIED